MKIRKFNESEESLDNRGPLTKEQVEDIFLSLEDLGMSIKIEEKTAIYIVQIDRKSDSYEYGWKPYSEQSKNILNELKTDSGILNELMNIISSLDKRKILYTFNQELKTNTEIAYSAAGSSKEEISNGSIIGALLNGSRFSINIKVWKEKTF